jgi:hypothetical protein
MSFLSTIDEPRTVRRARVLMSGMLLTRGGSQRVTVRDISRAGAQITGVRGLDKGADAIFQRGPIFAAARVGWVKEDEAGLSFYRELTAEEVDGCLPGELLAEP